MSIFAAQYIIVFSALVCDNLLESPVADLSVQTQGNDSWMQS